MFCRGFVTFSLAKRALENCFNSVGEPQFSFKRLQVTKNQLALESMYKISTGKY